MFIDGRKIGVDINMKKQERCMEWREKVNMPNKDFLMHAFFYSQEETRYIVPTHWHENLEFVCVQEGAILARCNDQVLTVSAGEAVVINSNDYHSFECVSAPLKICCVVADMNVLNSRFFDVCEEKYIQPLLHNQIVFNNLLCGQSQYSEYITQMTDEYIEKQIGYELAMKATLYNLLVVLLRNDLMKIMTFDESVARSKNHIRINKVLKYIEMNYTERICIDETAAMAGVSKYYFCKLFKKMTNKTLSDYVNNLRISEAVNLLTDTDMSVTDVATTVGYSDINYFSRLFKNVNGISPSMMRKNHRIGRR